MESHPRGLVALPREGVLGQVRFRCDVLPHVFFEQLIVHPKTALRIESFLREKIAIGAICNLDCAARFEHAVKWRGASPSVDNLVTQA